MAVWQLLSQVDVIAIRYFIIGCFLDKRQCTKVAKANKTIGFIKRNCKNAPEAVTESAYKALMRLQVECCATVWDPWTAEPINKIEMVQCRTALFVLKRYHQTYSMGAMLTQLGWETLQVRRAWMRVVLLYKATHQLVAVNS